MSRFPGPPFHQRKRGYFFADRLFPFAALERFVEDVFEAVAFGEDAFEAVAFFGGALADLRRPVDAGRAFAISPAVAPAIPPATAPTAAPTGPRNDPAAAPAAAPPTIAIPLFTDFVWDAPERLDFAFALAMVLSSSGCLITKMLGSGRVIAPRRFTPYHGKNQQE